MALGKIDSKLTEDQTVLILIDHLKLKGWNINSYCLGQQRGYDIVASKDEQKLFVEVKGARGNDNSPTKKRKYFDSGQIKDHFGKAIVKSLETINSHPNAKIAIAHPDDIDIRRVIGGITKQISKLGIIHYWVDSDKITIEDL
jgi:hypothetical protein